MTHPVKLWKTLLPAFAILFAFFAACPALGNPCVWNGSASGDWSNPVNWNTCGPGIPGSGDTVAIPNAGSAPSVFGGTTTSIGALTIQTGAVLTIDGGSVTLNAGMTGPGNLVVQNSGTLGWAGGTIDGTGATTFQPGTSFNLSGGAKTLGKSLTVSSTTVFSGAGNLTIGPGIVLHNLGSFEIQGDGGIVGAGGLFDNAGTLSRTTSSTNPLIQTGVNNGGSILVMTGGLTFTGDTTNSGTIDASAASLYYDAGTHTFDNQVLAGHIIISSAMLTFNGPATVFVGFTQDGAATVVHTHTTFTSGNLTQLDAGHFFVDTSSAVTNLGNLVVAPSATLTMNAFVPVVAASLNQGGTLEGNEDINVSGSAIWTGGIQLGPGATRFMGTTTFTGNLQNVGRIIDVIGPSTFDNGSIAMPSPASLMRILGPATMDFHFSGFTGGSGKLQILGSGDLTVALGVPITFSCLVTNAGIVTISLRVATFASYFQSAGTTELDLSLGSLTAATPLRFTGGTLTGRATIIGDLIVSEGASVSPGVAPGDTGFIELLGMYTQSSPVALAMDYKSPLTDSVSAGTALLGGSVSFSVDVTPSLGSEFPLVTYANRFGTFASMTLPPLPPDLFWTPRYSATTFSLRAQALRPGSPMHIDVHPASAGSHNGNGVLDPGERVLVEPSWSNPTSSPIRVAGHFSNFTGPAGASYTIPKDLGDYSVIPAGQSTDCFTATGDCMEVSVDNPTTRPAAHWDATVDEGTGNGNAGSWTIHIGGSFNDIAQTAPQYRFVETLFHNLITSGCGGGGFCPGDSVTRAQMAVFLLKAKFGASYLPPPATGSVFGDVPLSGFAPYIEKLAALSVTGGCGGGNYCPGSPATRAQMAVFLLKTEGGPSYTPPPCVTATFPDVPCSSGFAPWVQELVVRGITAGCGGGLYCPASPVTRGQMAVFLTTTFGLALNGQ